MINNMNNQPGAELQMEFQPGSPRPQSAEVAKPVAPADQKDSSPLRLPLLDLMRKVSGERVSKPGENPQFKIRLMDGPLTPKKPSPDSSHDYALMDNDVLHPNLDRAAPKQAPVGRFNQFLKAKFGPDLTSLRNKSVPDERRSVGNEHNYEVNIFDSNTQEPAAPLNLRDQTAKSVERIPPKNFHWNTNLPDLKSLRTNLMAAANKFQTEVEIATQDSIFRAKNPTFDSVTDLVGSLHPQQPAIPNVYARTPEKDVPLPGPGIHPATNLFAAGLTESGSLKPLENNLASKTFDSGVNEMPRMITKESGSGSDFLRHAHRDSLPSDAQNGSFALPSDRDSFPIQNSSAFEQFQPEILPPDVVFSFADMNRRLKAGAKRFDINPIPEQMSMDSHNDTMRQTVDVLLSNRTANFSSEAKWSELAHMANLNRDYELSNASDSPTDIGPNRHSADSVKVHDLDPSRRISEPSPLTFPTRNIKIDPIDVINDNLTNAVNTIRSSQSSSKKSRQVDFDIPLDSKNALCQLLNPEDQFQYLSLQLINENRKVVQTENTIKELQQQYHFKLDTATAFKNEVYLVYKNQRQPNPQLLKNIEKNYEIMKREMADAKRLYEANLARSSEKMELLEEAQQLMESLDGQVEPATRESIVKDMVALLDVLDSLQPILGPQLNPTNENLSSCLTNYAGEVNLDRPAPELKPLSGRSSGYLRVSRQSTEPPISNNNYRHDPNTTQESEGASPLQGKPRTQVSLLIEELLTKHNLRGRHIPKSKFGKQQAPEVDIRETRESAEGVQPAKERGRVPPLTRDESWKTAKQFNSARNCNTEIGRLDFLLAGLKKRD